MLWGYALGLVAPLAVLLLRTSLTPWANERPLLLLFGFPVILATWVGGFGPGLLATSFSALLIATFVFPPIGTLEIDRPIDLSYLLTYVVFCLLVSTLGEARIRLQSRDNEGATPTYEKTSGATLRTVRAGLFAALSLLCTIGIFSYWSVWQLSADIAWIRHTEDVLDDLHTVLGSIVDAETGQRGYAITGKPEFLEPYHSAFEINAAARRRLHEHFRDDPPQAATFRQLEPLVVERFQRLAMVIEVRDRSGAAAAAQLIEGGIGKAQQDRIRELVGLLMTTEREILDINEAVVIRDTRICKLVILVGSGLAVCVVALALVLINRDFAGARRAQHALHEANERLESRIAERTEELTRALAEVRLAENRLSGILESARDAIISIDASRNILLFNAAAERMFGVSSADVIGSPLRQFIPGQARDPRDPDLGDLLAHSVASPLPALLVGRRADHAEFPVEVSLSTLDSHAGRITTLILRDVTERERAQSLLRDRDIQLTAITDHFPGLLGRIDREMRYTYVNRNYERWFGRPREQIIGGTVRDLLGEQAFLRAEPNLRRVLSGESVTYTNLLQLTFGSGIEVEGTFVPEFAPDGTVVGAIILVFDVSARARAERELRDRERQLTIIADNFPGLFGRVGADGIIRFASRTYETWFGKPLSEIVGFRHCDLIGEDAFARVRPHIQRVLAGETVSFENTSDRLVGDRVHVQLTYVPEVRQDGVVDGFVMFAMDITERRRAEEVIRAREQRISIIAECFPGLLGSLDRDLRYRYVNKTYEQWFGKTDREIVGRSLVDLVGQEAYSRVRPHVERVLEGHSESFENWVLTADGRRLDAQITYVPEFGPGGDVQGFVVMAVDITARKRAEAALRLSEEQLRSFVDQAPVDMAMFDPNMCYLAVSRRWMEHFGRGAGALIGRCHYDIHPDMPPYWRGVHEQGLAGEASSCEEECWVQADGTEVWLRWAVQPWRKPDGAIGGIIILTEDISPRKRAEAALLSSEVRYQNLVQNMNEGVQLIGKDWRYLYFNDAAITHSRQRREDLIGRTMMECFPGIEQSELFTVLSRCMETGEPAHLENEFRYPDGHCGWFWLGIQRLDVGLMVLSLDVTARKQAELDLLRLNAELERRVEQRTAELLASNKELEAFSYSVSHDLRAPLRAVDGFSRILLDEYSVTLDAEGRRLLGIVRENAVQMDRLITDLLSLARVARSELTHDTIDMSAMARATWDEFAGAGECEGFEFVLGELPPACGDPTLLRQVWRNLLSNAIKYTRPKPVRRIEITATLAENETTYRVADTGVGFNPEYAHKLFGAFKRLHKVTEFEGTGIGLAIVQRIVSRHGGTVGAEAVQGQGATFRFTLPAKGGSNS